MSAIYFFTALILFGATHVFAADDLQQKSQTWTLEASVRRAVTAAPELHAAEAEIAARTGSQAQAEEWPNPTVTVRADEKIGIEDRNGGYNLNQVTITQALPLHRLEHQRRAATAALDAARASQNYQRLLLETRTARAFHDLQLAAERQIVAQDRLIFAEKLQLRDDRPGSDRIVRYMSPLERARLDILRAAAQQEVALAEGKWSEALALYRALLALQPESKPETVRLLPTSAPAEMGTMLSRLENHPALQSAQLTLDATRAAVDVAKSQRLADPTLSVIHEQDYLGGERRNYLGLMLGVQLPLWNRGNGGVARAHGEVGKAEAELELQRRDLLTRLRQSYLHLGHLVEQAELFQTHLLQPARNVLDLTRKGYIAGEQNGLALVDASNTYFDAQARYLELLRDAWSEAAELRLAAGVSLIDAATGGKP